MIKAKVVGHSVCIEHNIPIVSSVIVLPRIVLAELNTHRVISKNSASSRAIPHKRMVKSVKTNPFIPIAWQKEHTGMQGKEYHTGFKVKIARFLWILASRFAILFSGLLTKFGITKQLANRLLEPFMWHTVLITSTEWENYFKLRCPQYPSLREKNVFYRSKKDWKLAHPNIYTDNYTDLDWHILNQGQAEIHFMAVAECVWDAINESNPRILEAGEWHIPFIEYIDWDLSDEEKVKIATGMAARTTYTTFEGETEMTNAKLIGIHDKMVVANPFHASPFEHCAQASSKKTRSGNFRGWKQYRKTIKNG